MRSSAGLHWQAIRSEQRLSVRSQKVTVMIVHWFTIWSEHSLERVTVFVKKWFTVRAVYSSVRSNIRQAARSQRLAISPS